MVNRKPNKGNESRASGCCFLKLSLKCRAEWYLRVNALIVEFSLGTLLALCWSSWYANRWSVHDRSYSSGQRREHHLILFSKSLHDVFLCLQSWLKNTSHLKQTKKKKIPEGANSYSVYDINSEGKWRSLYAFMGWHFCLLYWYCFAMLSPYNANRIGSRDAASSADRKFNQSGIRRDVTSVWLFLIGR